MDRGELPSFGDPIHMKPPPALEAARNTESAEHVPLPEHVLVMATNALRGDKNLYGPHLEQILRVIDPAAAIATYGKPESTNVRALNEKLAGVRRIAYDALRSPDGAKGYRAAVTAIITSLDPTIAVEAFESPERAYGLALKKSGESRDETLEPMISLPTNATFADLEQYAKANDRSYAVDRLLHANVSEWSPVFMLQNRDVSISEFFRRLGWDEEDIKYRVNITFDQGHE